MSITSGPALGARIGNSMLLSSKVSVAVLLSAMRVPFNKTAERGPTASEGPVARALVVAGSAPGVPGSGVCGLRQAGDRLLPADDEHHVEHAWTYGPAGQRGPQRRCKLAQFQVVARGHVCHLRLQRLARPASILQVRRQFCQYTTEYIRQRRARLLIAV